jgi:hypothetical protein
MKLLLTTFCAALFISPLAFAEAKKCEKKCDKAKEETLLADCKKCDKDKKKEEAKKEGTVIAEAGQKKCGKKCDKEAEKESTLA